MENSTEIINELNKFLKGTVMGIDTFEQYQEKAESPELKNQLHHIITIFKSHEEKMVQLIQKLGGEPKDSLGLIGELSSMFEKVKDTLVVTDREVLERAIKAINMGKESGIKVLQTCNDLKADQYVIEYLTEILHDYTTTENKLTKMAEKL
ncbi:MAG: DUF2383 domain-containing protein [Turicibacter sp.]|nr:DUF2383 domain-containing protein [Turicibacter sp.]